MGNILAGMCVCWPRCTIPWWLMMAFMKIETILGITWGDSIYHHHKVAREHRLLHWQYLKGSWWPLWPLWPPGGDITAGPEPFLTGAGAGLAAWHEGKQSSRLKIIVKLRSRSRSQVRSRSGPWSGPKGPRTKDQRPGVGLTINLVCHHSPLTTHHHHHHQ